MTGEFSPASHAKKHSIKCLEDSGRDCMPPVGHNSLSAFSGETEQGLGCWLHTMSSQIDTIEESWIRNECN